MQDVPNIVVTQQRFIKETGYFLISGTINGLASKAVLQALANGIKHAEITLLPCSGKTVQWQLKNVDSAVIYDTIELSLRYGEETVLEIRLALKSDNDVTAAIDRIKSDHTVQLYGVDAISRTDNLTALNALNTSGFMLINEQLDQNTINAWMDTVDYENHYPDYVREFPRGKLLEAKAAQHCISARLSAPDSQTILMDTASSNSPFWMIASRLYGISESYRQDFKFKSGIHGDTVGSNVINIPMPDSSLSLITAHCSWEHFEGNADALYIGECARLLRPGGTLVIIPIYFADIYSAHTSPHIWSGKYASATEPPEFEKDVTIFLRESIQQRMARYYVAPQLINRILVPFSYVYDFTIYYYSNYNNIVGCPAFALKGIRK
jgi:hypothetical protein